MKKSLFGWLTIVMMAFVCVGFAACGGDDDGDGGGSSGGSGSGAMGGNGVSFNFNKAYFYAESGGNGKVNYVIQIFNCDYYTAIQRQDASMLPNELQSMNIMFSAEGTTTAIPTGEFVPFEALAVSIKKDDLINQTDEHGNQYAAHGDTMPLKISKSGNNYTISFGEMDFVNVFKGNDQTADFTSAFSYTGTLTAVPEGYFSVE